MPRAAPGRSPGPAAAASPAEGGAASPAAVATPAAGDAVAGPPGGDQSLPRRARVRRSPEYLRAYRRGRRRAGALMTLHYVPNEAGLPRLGVTVSRKVGDSVVRHRVKRRIVEAFRRSPLRAALPAWDFVAHVKPPAAAADHAALRQELEALLAGAIRGR
jgi:ribonuclease P protein component